MAAKYITGVIDESLRECTNLMTKNIIKSGARQFKALWTFTEKKLASVAELEEKVRRNSADVEKKLLQEQRRKDQEKIKEMKEKNEELKGHVVRY